MANFGPPPDVARTREIIDVRGFGGFLELSRGVTFGSAPPQIQRRKLEVEAWSLRHRFRKVELPLSGGFGAMTQRRVATSFTFIASLSWDVSSLPAGPLIVTDLFAGIAFLDDLFIGGSSFPVGDPEDRRIESTNRWTISALFALGNTSQYNFIFPGEPPAERAAAYYCDSVHLDELVVVTSTEPPDLVKMQGKGSGSAPLRRYSGPVWKGAGGFGFSRETQGHDKPI